jgi:PTH1 family peptidyl-tRNA hydrolase
VCSLPALRAVLALGNPGEEYHRSRHNLGFLVMERLARRDRVRFRREGPVELGRWSPPGTGREVLLARPLTFMNRSGAGALHLGQRHQVEGREMLVVLDDLDLPFGRLRLRSRGGAGTHNGLRSILEALGDEEFPRLRVGIGPAPEGEELSDWVLDEFPPEQLEALPEFLDRAADCVATAVREGVRLAMNRYNVA